jgi:hypothetical protein
MRRALIAVLLAALLAPTAAIAQPKPTYGQVTMPTWSSVPNAVCGTDITTALQAALTAGGDVVLPACPASNPLLVSATLNLPDNTTLRGQGIDRTWLKEASAANLIPMIQNAGAAGTPAANVLLNSNITVADLSIEGNGAAQTSGQLTVCISLLGVANINIHDVVVKDCRSTAVQLNGNGAGYNPGDPGTAPSYIDHLTVNGVVGPTGVVNGTGLQLSNRQRGVHVSNSFITNTAGHGILADASEGTYTNIEIKYTGQGSTGTATRCSPVVPDNPGGGTAGGQYTWGPCPTGFFGRNVSDLTVSNLHVTQSLNHGIVLAGVRSSTFTGIVSTNNSLSAPGTWDDVHLDLNSLNGYGEDHGLVMAGVRVGANMQSEQNETNSVNPPTSRYGFSLAAGIPASLGDATIVSGGTGYTTSDTLTVVGGTGTAPRLNVVGVSGGVITKLNNNPTQGMGSYSVLPTNPVALSGGAGSGATANIAWTSGSVTGLLVGQTLNTPVKLPAFMPGWSVQTVQPGYFRRLYFSGTPVSCTCSSTSVADVLQTYTLPVGVLANVGDTLHVVAAGTYANTTDTKTATLKFNSTAFAQNGAAVGANRWMFEMWMSKTGTSTQQYALFGGSSANTTGLTSGSAAIIETAPVAVTLNGINTTAATAGSVTLQYMAVDFIGAQ